MPPHGATLIQDLGIIVAGAAVASVVFRKLRLPVIFGYLLVGLMLGPGVFSSPLIGDMDGIKQVSELGVVFLLFFIGLEFDLTKLRRVFAPAFMAVAAQTIGMLILSRLLAPLLGWDYVSSLFFGSILAISSSMVTLRVLQEQGRDKMPHAQLATGIMILEDVLAVLLLVILSGVAVSRSFDWHALWLVSFLMGVFVVGIFFVGRLFAPRIVAITQGSENREALTIVSVGLVLGIGALALKLHFSGALGAFVAGAILSKTKLVQSVLNNNRGFRDLFSAVFFVTIGLQIEPGQILTNIGWIIALSVLMIVGKIVSCYLGMFLAGQSPEHSYDASAAKAQIGEFSFVIVALAAQLGVTDNKDHASLTAITFGIAFVSILLTPVISSTSGRQFEWLSGIMPKQLGRFAKFYRNYLDTVLTVIGHNKLIKLIKIPLTQIALYFFLISGIIMGGAYIARWVSRLDISSPLLLGLSVWVCTAVLSVPFVIAITRNISTTVFMITEAIFMHYNNAHALMQGRVSNLVNTLATLLTLLLLGGFFLSVASPYLPRGAALALFFILVIGICIFFWRKMIGINSRLESMFIDSFADDTHSDEDRRHADYIEKLKRDYPWKAGICEVKLRADSSACGKRIGELNLTRQSGSMIIAIVRGGVQVFDPSPEVPLFPEDRIIVMGTEDGNTRARQILEERSTAAASSSHDALNLGRVILPHGCTLDGNTLAGANLRHRFGVNIVGIQRGSQQITTPRADEMLKAGDMLIFVASPAHESAFNKFLSAERMESLPKPLEDLPPPTESARNN